MRNINFYGKAILVKSEAGAESTIINKAYSGVSILTFDHTEQRNSILDGFTIVNGIAGKGPAIYCYNSSPTINHNIIRNNTATEEGTIYSISGNPLIRNNVIEENNSSGQGTLEIVSSNSAIIDYNILKNNNVGAHGGGIHLLGCNGVNVKNNLLVNNRALTTGGGIRMYGGSSNIVSHNTLVGNNAPTGGGISIWNENYPKVDDNIIVGSNQGHGIYSYSSVGLMVIYNDVWNNLPDNYYGLVPGPGSISADPLFCDTATGNYYLSSASPCVGAGEGGTDIGAFGVGCGEQPRSVELSPGANKGGRAQSNVIVEFYVRNTGFLSDTYDLNITDSLGWTIVPSYYEVSLDSGQVDTITFTVSIPSVLIGTTDKLRLTALSQADPSVADTAYLIVWCNAIVEGVDVTAGSNQSGYADSSVSISYLVKNVGVVTDSYSLDISDSKGWSIVPLHYDITLDTGETEPAGFTVTIPYVPLGTSDQVILLAVSKSNALARDSATLTVTCNAYKEGLDVSPSSNRSGEANSHIIAKFYVQNTGIVTDSSRLTISDFLGWSIQPPSYKITLNPGQQDSVLFDVSIPSVPIGTTDKITLKGVSLTNPFVKDSTSLLTTCSSYNVTISGISDVGNDQGKQVSVKWSSFPGDDPLVTNFSVFRKRDSLLTLASSSPVDKSLLLTYPPGEWDWLVTIPAFGETLYSVIVPTLKDSTIAEGMYWSLFFIRAGTDNPTVYFDSPVDSGYSLDNLSPSPPTGLFASHKPAVTKLVWKKSNSEDFDYYTLYRDTTSQFQPSPNNRFAFSIDSVFTDSTAQLGEPYYYLVSATDFSGNESNHSNQTMGIRYTVGDANTDGQVSVSDIIYLINYLFKGGPAPRPIEAGNVNCENQVNITDVVYLINYLFKGGKPPCEP